jgi:cell division septal protein FtsQ
MVDERIARRRADVRSARRMVRLRRTLLVLTLVAFAGAGVWFERSEHATVVDVHVEGTSRLELQDVIETSGISVGDAALRIRTSSVARDVEQLVLVRSADVRRVGVRSVVIDVTERAPVYTVAYRASSVLVDRDGLVIDRGMEDGIPVVRVITPPPGPGEPVAAHGALANAHRAWTGLSGPLRSRVVAMRAPDVDGLELTLDTGQVVRFGRAEQLEEKIRALGAILDDVTGSEVVLIDVRVPGFPVVRID